MKDKKIDKNWQQEDLQETSEPNTDEDSLKKQKINRFKQNTKWRGRFSIWVMIIVPVWLVLVLGVVILCGYDCMRLNAMCINVLLGTTTANILGLAYIVLKGMFPPNID